MLSQFHVYIDDLNPARREVIRTMRYCVCEHTVNIYISQWTIRKTRKITPHSANTYTNGWPSGGDQGPVLGLGPFGSVPLQRSVKVGIDAPYLASSFPI